MEKGIKTLQTASRRREARANPNPDFDSDEILDTRFHPSRRDRSGSHPNEDSFDSGIVIGSEEHSFIIGNAFRSSREDHPHAPYSAGGMSNPSSSYSPAGSVSINSNVSSSLAGFTPTVTAAPQLPPIHQNSQTLPSFSTTFGISSVIHHSPRHSPAVTTH